MDTKDIILIILVITVIALVTRRSYYATQSTADKGEITVYGSKTCPWCVKQEKYLKDKGIPYTFVNCPTETCPDFVSGFPTLSVNGEIKQGYTEL
jgi:hypothetical protein